MKRPLKIFYFSLVMVAVVTTLLYQETRQAGIRYYTGLRYFNDGNYETAIDCFERSLAIDLNQPKVLIKLGYCYEWTVRHKQAIDTFEKALVYDPENYKLTRALAETCAWQGDYAKSIALYKELLAAGRGQKSVVI